MDNLSLESFNEMDLPNHDRTDILGNVRIVRLKGVINHDTLPDILKIRDSVEKVHGINDMNILFDLKKVTDVDSAAVAALIMRIEEVQSVKHQLGIVHIPKKFANMLDLFKKNNQIKVYQSEKEAVKDLNQ